MLFGPSQSVFLWSFDNYGANPGATPGTSVVPGDLNNEGLATVVATAAQITQDVYWILLRVSDGGTATAAKPHVMDIGVDPAGGTSYTWLVNDMVCGASAPITASAGGFNFFFPLFIKAGSQVAVRIKGSHATAGTVRICMKFYGRPSRPETRQTASFSETIGTITNADGVSFTPGNAADGTWVSLGTTAKAMWWWLLCYQINNATITAEYTYIDLAYGDATNKHQIKRLMHVGNTSEFIGECFSTNMNIAECYCPLPAGATLYVRGRCLNAPDTGYNACAVGFGG